MDRHQPSTRSFIPQRSPVFGSVPCESPMRLSICSTTGSRFEVSVPQGETLEGLRRRLSQRLRIPKDRLVFLHKETQMTAGKLVDQGVSDGSKLTLVPAVEAGLTSQPPRTDHTMIQALENLTETQVSDFLSGRSPLTLALGIGAHLMYVQLQLASQNAVGQQHHGNRNGGKVHSGKSGSSRVPPRPYPSPTHPSFVSHPLSPTGTSSPTSSPPSHRTPVIRQPHPGPATLHGSSPPHTPQTRAHPHIASPAPSPLPSHGPPPCLSPFPTAPLCPPHVVCSSPAPPSPAPLSPAPPSPTPAAPYPEDSCSSSSAPPSREPGAVIESFVSHSPGVFSGTFSGTLPPISQSGVSHPRRGIATILQILNDLLSATRHHQGAPASLCQLRGPGPASPSCPLTSDPPPTTPSRATSEPSTSSLAPRLQQTSPPAKHAGEGGPQQQPSSSEENRALRRKLENLQLLMYQRRLRRRARRGAHPSHASAHPYSQRLRHPWSPGQRKAARRHSNSSLSGSEGTSQDDMEADEVMEESPWKPELTSDLVVV